MLPWQTNVSIYVKISIEKQVISKKVSIFRFTLIAFFEQKIKVVVVQAFPWELHIPPEPCPHVDPSFKRTALGKGFEC